MDDARLVELGRSVLTTEAAAVASLGQRLDTRFAAACRLILDCKGRTITMGMGKSGHIAGKVAATLASTGSLAFFVHAGEAGHGDLGMIAADDVVVAFSHSGETEELVRLLPLLKRLGVALIVVTGRADSTLAAKADVYLDAAVDQEACPLGLAPTASTTVALALGDALAVTLLEARGFNAEDFARAHPSGALGRRLLLRVRDIMHTGNAMACVPLHTTLSAALVEMTRKGLGTTAVVDEAMHIQGIYTDGDLRRTLDSGTDIRDLPISRAMTRNCKTVSADCLAAEALGLMETNRINALLVAAADGRLIGMLNMHDLLRAKVI